MAVKSVAHVGFTVSDLDRSVAFYSALLGQGPHFRRRYDEPYISEIIGYPGCSLEIALFRLPGTEVELELLRYYEPPPGRVDLETYNAGNAHLCLTVDDWDAAYARLQGLGAAFRHDAPVRQTAGEFEGSATVYLRDPDGITIELYEPVPTPSLSEGADS